MKTTQIARFSLINSGNPPPEINNGQAHLHSELHIYKHNLLNSLQNFLENMCVGDIIHLKLLFP